GASAPSLTIVNNRMQRVLFWEMFDEGNTCAGEVFSAAQTDIIQTQGAGGLNNARMYHWFGDPSMDICNSDEPGAPFAMSADFPGVLNTGENNLTVTVTSSGVPVQGALVTVTDGIGNHPDHTESFYAQGITDASGQTTLSFTVLEGHDLYYGVRLHNHGSLHGTIDVTTEGIEGGTPASIRLMPVSPSPARSAATVSFQAPPGAQTTLRVLDLTGRTVATLLQGSAPGGISTHEMDIRDFSPGIYFAVLQSGGTTLTERMTVVR
ncbi:MAG TPA: T9SS type A sorting domain-containing protein, partial [Candidatus Sabulitectum sp.]|nr:T9SS type A sorting domain-containing protein [Candidatus Sabulitectum sp.]